MDDLILIECYLSYIAAWINTLRLYRIGLSTLESVLNETFLEQSDNGQRS